MSVQAITWALDYAAGSVTEKVLLLVLANYANEFGVSWPSQKTLADQTALGERTVRRVLADMERRGVIRRIIRRRGDGSRQSDMILLAAFEGRKPAPPGMLDDGPDRTEIDAPDQPANGDNRPKRPLGSGCWPNSRRSSQAWRAATHRQSVQPAPWAGTPQAVPVPAPCRD
jgi:DNA-binding transcriptional MocR family regulator